VCEIEATGENRDATLTAGFPRDFRGQGNLEAPLSRANVTTSRREVRSGRPSVRHLIPRISYPVINQSSPYSPRQDVSRIPFTPRSSSLSWRDCRGNRTATVHVAIVRVSNRRQTDALSSKNGATDTPARHSVSFNIMSTHLLVQNNF